MPFDQDGVVEDQIRDWARDRRDQLLDERSTAAALGCLQMRALEPYRPLTDDVKARVVHTMRLMFPRPDDADMEEPLSPGFRKVLQATLEAGHRFLARGPYPDGRGDRKAMRTPPPSAFTPREVQPRPWDPNPVLFHPSNGKICPVFWPELSEKDKPRPLSLPGCNWPDDDPEAPFPLERAWADLARVRWAPGRATIWLAPGAPEPA
jgi:hypothetical protein